MEIPWISNIKHVGVLVPFESFPVYQCSVCLAQEDQKEAMFYKIKNLHDGLGIGILIFANFCHVATKS